MPYTRVDDPEKLRRLMAAVLMIEAEVDLTDLLRHVVGEAQSLVGARYAALGVLNESRTGLEQFFTVGLTPEEEELIGRRPTGRGVLGQLITDPVPLRAPELSTVGGRYGFPAHHPTMSSFLGVPVRVRDDVYGNLYLTDKEEGTEFTDEDEAMAETLALAAGIAIENNRLHDRARIMSLLDDRDRIARDLHDRVIQRVYAVGMSLQVALRLPERDEVLERVSRAIEELDQTMSEIRGAIFELGQPVFPGSVRQAVLHLAEELSESLGARPEVRFEGPIDTAIPQHVGDHIVAVVREGLTNAGKHAAATRFVVLLGVSDEVTLQVADNGHGIEFPLDHPGLGLDNLRARATRLGGTFEVLPAQGGGTRLVWSVPLG